MGPGAPATGPVVVVAPAAPQDIPAEPIPAEVTIEAPTPAAPTQEELAAAASSAIQDQREELRQELKSEEQLNRLRSDTQSLRDQMTNLQAKIDSIQASHTEALGALTAELRGVLVALTEAEEAQEGNPPQDPAAPSAGPEVELAPTPTPRRSIWEAFR